MSILIKNGLIYDGTGQKPEKKDVLIRKNQIKSIGDLKNTQADKTIDAEGKNILPGFIDINSGIDHHLKILTSPHQKTFLEQGVTTAIGGNNGSSLAPFSKESLETIKKWGSDELQKTNIDWESFKEFLNSINNKGLKINFGSFVGHSSIKRMITKNKPRDLTQREIKLSQKILKESLNQGALGLSVSLEYGFTSETPKNEIKELIKIIKKTNKTYVTDFKYPDKNPQKSLKEIINLTENIKTEINHLQPLKSSSEQYLNIIDKLQKISSQTEINFDSYPAKFIKTPIYQFLPKWLERPTLKEVSKIVKSGRYDNEIKEHLKKYTRRKIKFTHVPSEFKSLKNKTLKKLSDNREKTQIETMLQIMKLTNLKPVCTYYNVDQKILSKLLQSESSIIASNGTHFEIPEYNPFLEYLKFSKNNKLPLEKAVAKITSKPASKLNIKKRGKIKEGYYADISIMKDDKIDTVFVNGKITYKNNNPTKTKSGEIIK